MPRMAATSAAVQHLRDESARVDRSVTLILRTPSLDCAALFQSSCDCTLLCAAFPGLWILLAQSRVTRPARELSARTRRPVRASEPPTTAGTTGSLDIAHRSSPSCPNRTRGEVGGPSRK